MIDTPDDANMAFAASDLARSTAAFRAGLTRDALRDHGLLSTHVDVQGGRVVISLDVIDAESLRCLLRKDPKS